MMKAYRVDVNREDAHNIFYIDMKFDLLCLTIYALKAILYIDIA